MHIKKPTQPPTAICEMEAKSEYMLHVAYMFGADLHAQSVLSNKITSS